MKKSLTTFFAVSAVSMFLIGCGGGSGKSSVNVGDNGKSGGSKASKTIIGKWKNPCEFDKEDGTGRIEQIEFKKDGTFYFEKIKYSDDKCTDKIEKEHESGTYKVGKETVDSENKKATELDIHGKSPEEFDYYTMYRILESGNLALAHGNDENEDEEDCGETAETRCKYMDDDGFIRVK